MQDSPRSTIVIWVIAAAVAVLAGMRLLGGGSADAPPVSIDGGPSRGGGGDRSVAVPGSAGSKDSGGELYVHVAGAVRRPGLLRLPAGSRVASALEKAGGPARRADLTLVNLAAPVQDGQQIVVPVRGAGGGVVGGALGGADAAAGGATGAAAATSLPPGAKVRLSTATPEELDQIDGIGPTLAGRIVEYRDAHGGFRSVDELAEVEGIGEKRLATLRDALQP